MPDRRSLLVVELNEGFTVSQGDAIYACADAQQMAERVFELFTGRQLHTYEVEYLEDIEAPPRPPDPPPTPAPRPPEQSKEPDTGYLADWVTDLGMVDVRVEAIPPATNEWENLDRLIHAYTFERIDAEEFTDGVKKYCPSIEPEEVNRRLLIAQGVDPARYTAAGRNGRIE